MKFAEKFERAYKKGLPGEELIKSYLLNKCEEKKIAYVGDFRNNPYYQKLDIDFEYKIHGTDKVITMDVKTDYRIWKTDNVVFELCKGSLNSPYDLGINVKCQAEELWLVDMHNKIVYIIDNKEFKEFVDKHYSSVNAVRMGDTSYGYLIPLMRLFDYGIIKNKIDLEEVI